MVDETNLATIDTTPPQPALVSIDSPVAPTSIPNPSLADSRTFKANMGMGQIINKAYDDIYRSIASGQEDALRADAANKLDFAKANAQQQKIVDLANQRGSALNLQEVQAVINPQAPENQPINPGSVMEKSYATAYVQTANDAAKRMESPILDDAAAENPEALAKYFQAGSDALSRREYAMTKGQNLQPVVDSAAWLTFNDPWGNKHNIGKSDVLNLATFGMYNEFQMRNNTENTSRFKGVGLGQNLDFQARELLSIQDYNEFTRKFDASIKDLPPEEAQRFAYYVANMSTSDKILENMMSGLNFLGASGVVGAVRGVLKSVGRAAARTAGETAVKNEGNLIRGADGVYRPAPTTGTDVVVANAVKDVVKSASAPEITPAVIAEGSGDLGEAAAQRAADLKTKPNGTKETINTLLTYHRADANDISAAPGNLSRENLTRILDAGNSFEANLIDTAVNTSKVERTPAAAAGGFREAIDRVKQYFPGSENTLADVNVRYEYPNTYWHDVRIVNYDGTQFSSPALARNHALNMGYGDPAIISDAGKAGQYYIPTAAIKRNWETNDRFGNFRVVNGQPVYETDDGAYVDLKTQPEEGYTPVTVEGDKFKMAPALTEKTVKVAQQGLGFHLVVSLPLNETQSFIRDGLIKQGGSSAVDAPVDPKAISASNPAWGGEARQWANAIGGYVRSPNDTMSKYEVANRNKVDYTKSRFLKIATDEMKYIEDLYRGLLKADDKTTGVVVPYVAKHATSYVGKVTGKNSIIWDQFVRTLDAARNAPDPITGLPGYFMKTPAEIQNFYQLNYKRPATFQEQQAYFAFTRLYTYDLFMRDTALLNNKLRLGAKEYTLRGWLPVQSTDGKLTESMPFDAVRRITIPGGEDLALVHDSNGNVRWWNSMNPNDQNDLREKVLTGQYQVVEIYDPEARPLKMPDTQGNPARVRYVISNALVSKDLNPLQLGRRGGGHFEYDYDFYIKKPIIRRQRVGGKWQDIYEGDATLMPIRSRVDGADIAAKFNEAQRLLFVEKNAKAAKKYMLDNHLDVEWKEFTSWFRKNKNPATGEWSEPRFNKDLPFEVVSNGKTIFDKNKNLEDRYRNRETSSTTFVDGTRHGSLARNFQVAYTGKRDSYDLFTFKNVGNKYNPVYQQTPAEFTDPIATMSRALNRIINSTFMDDYKIFSAEHWLQENIDLLDADVGEIRSSPFYHFNEVKYKRDAPEALKRIAESNRYKIKELIGTPSTWDTAIQGMKQSLVDSMYAASSQVEEKAGKNALTTVVKAPLLVPEWMLSKAVNPIDFARSMVYHMKMGLWSVPQIMLQQSNWVLIAGMAPTHVMQAGFGAMMHQWTRINKSPAIVDYLDSKASAFGWKPGVWKEAMRVLDNTGFENVGTEFAMDNGSKDMNFVKGDVGYVMDTSLIFMKGSERHMRLGAWYAAFHEFRTKFPNKPITPAVEGELLSRANDFYGNMNRASGSMLNKGFLGFITQFYAFAQRIFELFWSKRLADTTFGNWRVRAQIFTLYFALFGVGSLGLTGLPISDFVRKSAMEKGYVIGNNALESWFYEGGLSLGGALITGNGDFQVGNWYNFNSRVGANGYQPIKEFLISNKEWWQLFAGAAGTNIAKTAAGTSGWFHAMLSMIEGRKGEEAFPMTLDDWIEPLKNVSSWNYYKRLIYALEYKRWLDSHEQVGMNVSRANAVFMTFTSLSLTKLEDVNTQNWTMREESEARREAIKEYSMFARRAEDAYAQGNNEQGDKYNTAAFARLVQAGVPREQWGQIIAQGAKGYESTIDKNDNRYYTKYVPEWRKAAAEKAYRDKLLLQEKSEPKP